MVGRGKEEGCSFLFFCSSGMVLREVVGSNSNCFQNPASFETPGIRLSIEIQDPHRDIRSHRLCLKSDI